MIDLWETLGRLVSDDGLAQNIKAAANLTPASPTLLLVRRATIAPVKQVAEDQPWSKYMSVYAAGEVGRFIIHPEYDTIRTTIRNIQLGLRNAVPANPSSQFYQTLGSMIIDPNVGDAIEAAGSFPKFARAMTGAEQAHLSELAANPA